MRTPASSASISRDQAPTFAIITLAFWQLRQVWRFFLLVTLGMIAAVVLACSLPLFSLVNTTAGVRSTFNNGLFDPTSSVQGETSLVSSSHIKLATRQVTQLYQHIAGASFSPPVFSLIMADSVIFQHNQLIPNQVLALHGYDPTHISAHLQLLQGHLPQPDNQVLEIAVSTENAAQLHAQLGSLFTIYSRPTDTSRPQAIHVLVVGIFRDVSFYDPFWHGDALVSFYDSITRTTHDAAVVNNTALLSLFDQFASQDQGQAVSFAGKIFWNFPLNSTAINSTTLTALTQQLNALSLQVSLVITHPPYVNNITVTNTDLLTLIQSAHAQTSTTQVPILLLLAIMLCLILFFTSLMTELLVTCQAETVAMLYTRGASLGQIFLTFVFQSLLLGALTILVSPLLTVAVVHMLIQFLLPVADQGALNALPTSLWETIGELGWYLLAAVAITILTMCATIWRTLNASTLGRSTPATQYPFWQKYYLDVLLIILGSLIYALSAYLASTGIINEQLQVLLVGPCTLVAATLLSLAGMLLYLRCFPWLLRLGASIAARGRGITPLLSLEIMSRTPRQTIRMSLLLIMTIAFAIFSLIFTSTQTQRTYDLADYRSGADFSGQIEQTNASLAGTLALRQERYQHIPGVLSAAVGFAYPYSFLHTPNFIQLVAIDPHSFASSVIWSQESPEQNIPQMLNHLSTKHTVFTSNAPAASPLPAIVDTATKDLLHLSPGQTFSLSSTGNTLTLIDIGEIAHIPGIDDALIQGSANKQGILVDYESFVPAYQHIINNPNDNLTPNAVWLHTRQDPTSHATVRRTLMQSSLALEALADHQALLQQLQHDPLYLNIICALTLGVFLSLLLAFFGMLISVWLSVKNRIRSLAVLRALGTSPGQLLQLLAWEQGIVYITTIILGLLAGFFFTLLTLSSLIFSGTAQTSSLSNSYTAAIYFLQFTPRLQISIPASLFLALGGVIILGTITLAVMIYTTSRPSLAQILRLSEDYIEEAPAFVARTLVSSKQTSSTKQDEPTYATKTSAFFGEIPGLWTRLPLRNSWSHQFLIVLGILLSVILLCVIPLFSQIAATAGLRDVLSHTTNQYASAQITSAVDTSPAPLQFGDLLQVISNNTATLNHLFLAQSQPFFHASAIVTIQANILPQTPDNKPPAYAKGSPLEFFGLSQASLPAHILLLQGHLPQRADTLQIALTPAVATYLHVKVGDTLTQHMGYPLTMQVVGIFQPKTPTDPLLPTNYLFFATQGNIQVEDATALVSSEGLLQADATLMQSEPQNHPWFLGSINWYYHINSQQVTIGQLESMITTFSKLEQNNLVAQNTLPLNELSQYQKSVSIANVPILTISILTIGLILLFLNLISEMLVEREINTITVLRSRGATRRQIFSTFFTHLLILGGTGVILGVALVIPVLAVVVHFILLPIDANSLTTITNQPFQSLLSVSPYIFVSLLLTLATLSIAIYRAASMNTATLRQEAARSTHRPFWQRFYLDLAGMIIALAAYAFSFYLTNTDVFSPEVNVQVKSPLVLLATVGLMLTSILLFLRLFPSLLRIGTMLALRNRGIESMLAITQMARAPRQSLRVTLLLISTTAFVVFISLFTASQDQHIHDVAQYWTGADFSGPLVNQVDNKQLASLQKTYLHLPGVLSVSTGYISQEMNPMEETTKVLAVEPTSFIHTINWPEMSTPQQQQHLIQSLISQRDHIQLDAQKSPDQSIFSQLIIPAIVDTHTWDILQLSKGQEFQLDDSLNYIAVGKVNAIPSSTDSGQSSTQIGSQTSTILVDYKSYALAHRYITQGFQPGMQGTTNITPLNNNYVWLRTRSDSQTLRNIRNALAAGQLQLAPLADREAIMQNLENDPLSLELRGNLLLGALAPLILTWPGCLLASWTNASQRTLLFSVLRALGGTHQQLKRILIWEQALVYGIAILLGSIMGLLTAVMTLPSLILTSKLPQDSTQDLFSLQNIPPVHIIIPASLLPIIALFIGPGIISVLLMNRVISWTTLSQTLRLNED